MAELTVQATVQNIWFIFCYRFETEQGSRFKAGPGIVIKMLVMYMALSIIEPNLFIE